MVRYSPKQLGFETVVCNFSKALRFGAQVRSSGTTSVICENHFSHWGGFSRVSGLIWEIKQKSVPPQTKRSSIVGVRTAPPRPKTHRKRWAASPPTFSGGLLGGGGRLDSLDPKDRRFPRSRGRFCPPTAFTLGASISLKWFGAPRAGCVDWFSRAEPGTRNRCYSCRFCVFDHLQCSTDQNSPGAQRAQSVIGPKNGDISTLVTIDACSRCENG